MACRLNYFPPFRVGVSLSMETVLLPLETLQSAIATMGVIPVTLTPLLQVPPASRGGTALRARSVPLPTGGTLRRLIRVQWFSTESLRQGRFSQRMQGSLYRFGRRACRLAQRLQAQRRVRHEQQRVQHILQVWLWHHGVYTPCCEAFLPARGILQGVKTMPTATARPRRKRLTERDLLQMPSDGRKYELVNGRLQIVPTGARHGEIVSNLIGRLHAAKTPTVALYSEAVGFRMRNGNIRSPDASVMRRERLPDGVSPDEFVDGAPDLAVEVVSPSERAAELLQKVAEYFSPIAIPLWDSHPKRKNES